ncbi:MAG: hypothetical protein K6T59_10450 [Bryobacteraceae bacterium]|nr:hypothetical protein [Bryobacteraceae bacterium]
MRDVDDEVLADALELFQLGPLALELLGRRLEFTTRFVELTDEETELGAALLLQTCAEIPPGQFRAQLEDPGHLRRH